MAINVDKKSQVVERKLYTGLTFVNWVATNPTLSELQTLLYPEYDKEPVYENDKGDFILELWLKNEQVLTKLRFQLNTEFITAKSGKLLFINNVGNYSYSESKETLESNEKMKWFTKYPFRQCRKGEQQLLDFIITLGNLDTNSADAEITLDKFNELCKGNLSEIKTLQKAFENDKIGIVLGVNEKGYQSIWTSLTTNTFVKAGKNLSKVQLTNLTDSDNGFKDSYTVEFKEYVPNIAKTEDLDFVHKQTQSMFGALPVPPANNVVFELPDNPLL